MLRNWIAISMACGLCALIQAQTEQPQVKVNVLNVCAPSAEERKQIASALGYIARRPAFSQEFEVDRGRSLLEQNPDFLQSAVNAANTATISGSDTASWVRIRRELSVPSVFSTVQYSFSQDPKNMVETLVFHVRDPKDLLQVSLEDSAAAVTTPASMLATNTPAGRIKLERFGASSIVLARCTGSEGSPPPDQSAYEALFEHATEMLALYRNILGARHTVPEELSRLGPGGSLSKPPGKAATKKSPSGKSP